MDKDGETMSMQVLGEGARPKVKTAGRVSKAEIRDLMTTGFSSRGSRTRATVPKGWRP